MTTVAANNGTGALPFGVAIPFAIDMVWANVPDIDLHMTLNDASAAGQRIHINFANQGNYLVSPFAQLDEDQTGVGGSETIGIASLTAGAPYRVGVFNFGGGAAGVGTTTLSSQANVVLRYITNGQISRGPAGSTIVNGTVRASVSPTPGQPGNVWLALEINPANGAATVINRLGNSDSSAGTAAFFDPPTTAIEGVTAAGPVQ